ncbi:MAG TPA: vanadium-dependent haloperoxidase [Isosphaeraceae bacterium]|nr:vanadium-dependent haloperoxidase [Isosphaeraceae bacterium]
MAAPALKTSATITITMPAQANGTINGVATHRVMLVRGHTFPGARVRLEIGKTSRVTHAGLGGRYQFRVAMAPGSYVLTVDAKDRAGAVASATMTMTHGDAVIAWINTMIDAVKADVSNVGLVSRTMAMMSAAVYDAVNNIEGTHAVFQIHVPAPSWASPEAAATEAAYTVLSSLYPNLSPMFKTTRAQSLAAIPAGPARDAGIAVGREVADGIIKWRTNDGSAVSVPYVPGTAPGQWRPTPPTYTVAWGPDWGNVKPFAIQSPATYLPPPPPALNSPEYAEALNQVESLGALNSTTRTPDETQAAFFWSYDDPTTGTPPVHFDQIVEDLALQQHNSLAQNARLFGLINVAMGDVAIAAWNAKYTYNFWRPITAIQLANTDGNPATIADPTWTPLGSPGASGQPSFTPPFPSYVSGHATFGGAVFTILADFYGTDQIHFTIGSDMLPGVTRSFDSFSAAALENAWSRVWLGVHYSFDSTEGLSLGDSLGNAIYHQIMGSAASAR